MKELKFTVLESLPPNSSIIQTDHGLLLINFQYDDNDLICNIEYTFRRTSGEIIVLDLPKGKLLCASLVGNAFYFLIDTSNVSKLRGKIYKAIISSGRLEINYEREMKKCETVSVYRNGTIYRSDGEIYRDDGVQYAYRICDHPLRDAVQINESAQGIMREANQSYNAIIIKNSKAYIIILKNKLYPSVKAYPDNHIILEIPIKPKESMYSFHNEPSPFIYFAIGLILYAFNTATLEFLPALQVVGNQIQSRFRIVGVCNGVITVQTKNSCLATAQLPRGYFLSTEPSQKEETPVLSEKIDGHSSKQTSELQTSTVAFDELFDQCSCSICFETFDAIKCIPRVLDCGHTFCEVCLLNEKLGPSNQIKCPNCSKIHKLSNEKELPINYFAINIAEQTMKSRIDSRVVCTSCSQQCSSSSVRMCMKSDCTMFEKLICLTCVVDDNHGGHVVKYDVKLEKIRGELREKVSNLQTKVEEKQQNVLKKAEQLGTMIEGVKTNFTKIAIPTSIIGQLETLASAQDAIDYEEIVKDLSETIINQCEILTGAFDHTLNAAKGLELFDNNTEHKETIDGEEIENQSSSADS